MTRDGWLAGLAAHGERPAVRMDGVAIDYAELARRAATAGEALERAGVSAGQLVAVLAPPSIAGTVLIHGALARGVVLLPLNARLAPSEQELALEASEIFFEDPEVQTQSGCHGALRRQFLSTRIRSAPTNSLRSSSILL